MAGRSAEPPTRSAGGVPASPRTALLATRLETPWNAEALLPSLEAPTTETARFFVRSHFDLPSLDPTSWRLEVTGEVERPRSWSLAELEALPQHRLTATLECAGNSRRRFPTSVPGEIRWGDGAVGSAVWQGVPLSRILQEAHVRPSGREVVFRGGDRGVPSDRASEFSRGLSVDLARTDDLLLATRMNGERLGVEHGFPVRLVVPGWYGMAWVKWLAEISVRRVPYDGYFQASKYVYRTVQDGVRVVEPVRQVRVKSLVLSPVAGQRLERGRRWRLAGKAWSGSGPVRQVEVDVGDGWKPARLRPGAGRFDWSHWQFDWTPERPGRVTVRSRATDAAGRTQPEALVENEFQYGANAVHAVEVEVA